MSNEHETPIEDTPQDNAEVETTSEEEVETNDTVDDKGEENNSVVNEESGGNESYYIMPVALYKDVVRVVDNLPDLKDKDIPEDVALAYHRIGLSHESANVAGGRMEDIINGKVAWVVNPEFGDKHIGIREVKFKPKKEGTIVNERAFHMFMTSIGRGNTFQIPLWHSGFQVALVRLDDNDIVDIQARLASEYIELGRATSTFIFTNYSVIFVRIIMEIIISKLDSVTFELKNKDTLAEHIMIQDIGPLFAGLANIIFPHGHKITRQCSNTLVMEDPANLVPKCTHTANIHVRPKDLLRVNRDALTDKQLARMSETTPNAAKLEEVREYQNKLDENGEKIYAIKTNQMGVFKIRLKAPNVAKYIKFGELWINNVISMEEKFFTEDLTMAERNARVWRRSKLSTLNAYGHYIDEIFMDEGDNKWSIKKPHLIQKVLEVITGDEEKEGFNQVKEAFHDYIDTHVVAMAAIQNYVCPTCKEIQKEEHEEDPFRAYIPIDPINYFFALGATRVTKTKEKELE